MPTTTTQGSGIIPIMRGAKFDASRAYYAEAVLNLGTAMEVKGQKVPVPVAQLRVLTDEGSDSTKVDEIKFGDGSNAKKKKRYRIELQSKAFVQTCGSLSGTIKSVLSSGATVTALGDAYYPVEYNQSRITFTQSSSSTGCTMQIDGKQKFIVSNRSTADLNQLGTVSSDTAVLYGGIGSKVQIIVNGARKEIPIEPVGVIVLGIDGLRQDVLYPNELDKVQDGGLYRVDISTLPGLKQVLAGYDQPTEKQQYIMLPKVTAIFPSVTLASWASIFTGKMPGPAEDVVDSQGNVIIPRGTGILGNEFFARDLSFGVPHEKTIDNPRGLITFDSGASRGYDAFPKPQGLYYKEFFIPYQFSWDNVIAPVLRFDSNDPADPGRSPQNDPRLLIPHTVFENVSEMPGIKKYFDAKGGDPVVVSYSHYSRGAYWVTWDTPFPWGEANTMDKASTNKFVDYLKGKYATIPYTTWLRNKTPFSALTVWYLPGLDHQAHIKGMDAYKSYFQNTTDDYIKSVVNTLKGLDEFDNKIFIIVADHGHTAMPTPASVTLYAGTPDERSVVPYTSCELKLIGFQKKGKNREAELANNNLHIWEFGETLLQLNKLYTEIYPGTDVSQKIAFNILAPSQIADLNKNSAYGAKKTLNEASVIAALDGPMAHIYVKDRTSNDWKTHGRIVEDIGYLSEVLRLLFSSNKTPSNVSDIFPYGLIDTVLFDTIGISQNMAHSVDAILIRKSVSPGEKYCVYRGIKSDRSDIECDSLLSYFGSGYVNAVDRINNMENAERSGDIVLLMQDSTSGEAINRYTTGVACKSWHGSLNLSDSYVPFIVAYPGGNKYELNTIIDRQSVNPSEQSVCPGLQCVGNWKLTDIVKEMIKIQY